MKHIHSVANAEFVNGQACAKHCNYCAFYDPPHNCHQFLTIIFTTCQPCYLTFEVRNLITLQMLFMEVTGNILFISHKTASVFY